MTVNAILAGKGREVVSIEPSASLASAVRLLARKRIGAALILGADRRIAGIFSERDIVRVACRARPAALEEPVSRTMTRKVATCNENETVCEHHGAHDRGQIPSCARGRSGSRVGIVSIGDVVKHRLHQMERDFGGDARLHPDCLSARA